MARIEEKRKEKLSSTIGTWVVFGILGAVVITGIVLLIIYLVGLGNNNNSEKTFEDRFPESNHLTFEQLEGIINDDGEYPIEENVIYVLIYSANFEEYEDVVINEKEEKTFTQYVDDVVGVTNFFTLNVEDEENKEYTITNEDLSNISNGDKYPVLVIVSITSENGYEISVPEEIKPYAGEDGIVYNLTWIVDTLAQMK